MANITKQKNVRQHIRARRVRARIKGTSDRPRLSVHRSSKHIYAQAIDDLAQKTLAAASDKDILETKGKLPLVIAREVGAMIAKRALEQGIQTVVFDRGPYLYHGRVATLAQGARDAGLTI